MPANSPLVTVIEPDALKNDIIELPGVSRTWGEYERHYLAEGDSWFSMSDLFSQSFLYRFGIHVPLKQRTLIVNCSNPGEHLDSMANWRRNINLNKLLFKKGFTYEWDGVMLTAGGNDIIAAAMEPNGILQPCSDPHGFRDFLNVDAMELLGDQLEGCFMQLVKLRDDSTELANQTIPIWLHNYGYATPRNAGVAFGFGPWLYKAFKEKNIPEDYWIALSDFLMDQLSDLLRRFTKISGNIHLVDTLNNAGLIRAESGSTGNSGDWLNEIHLNDSGKDKVARCWAEYL